VGAFSTYPQKCLTDCLQESSWVEKKAVEKFHCEQLVDLLRMIPVSVEVALDHSFDPDPVEVWPGECPRVEQHFPNIVGEGIPIPDSEMIELVPTKEKALQMDPREKMIDPGHPLGHPVVARVFCLEGKLEQAPIDSSG
jgi:hypothetical protein